jgi:hypothetical protein
MDNTFKRLHSASTAGTCGSVADLKLNNPDPFTNLGTDSVPVLCVQTISKDGIFLNIYPVPVPSFCAYTWRKPFLYIYLYAYVGRGLCIMFSWYLNESNSPSLTQIYQKQQSWIRTGPKNIRILADSDPQHCLRHMFIYTLSTVPGTGNV